MSLSSAPIHPQVLPTEPTLWPEIAADVVIVGGGIVGLTLALALSAGGLEVVVVEAQTLAAAASRDRAYALSLTSANIFQGLGLWSEMEPGICQFQQVDLCDGDYGEVVRFLPADLGTEAVYYGAEHAVLMGALQGAAIASPRLRYLSCASLSQLQPDSDGVTAQLTAAEGAYRLRTRLLVAADGRQSSLRKAAKIGSFGWQYWQSCITTVVAPAMPHQARAYERFWPAGPLAILPLPGQRCQVVWTLPHAEAQKIMELSEPEFIAHLQRYYGNHMGPLKQLKPPGVFSVQLTQSDRYIQPRLALVGDAAHSCHPVGGQGLNMGIRDAAALAEVLIAAHQYQEDLGSMAVLRRYERWRRPENWLILTFTDLLNRSFSNQIWPVVVLRRMALIGLGRLWPLRRLALQLMTGQLGRLPQLAIATALPTRKKPGQ
ncbi:MAG: FAD-dependent hydroxylase [Cyanobacteria bacterium REEB459]|nr:FAD-dependent hydroxylase [Cyanobacteria bacterium REEB459]